MTLAGEDDNILFTNIGKPCLRRQLIQRSASRLHKIGSKPSIHDEALRRNVV